MRTKRVAEYLVDILVGEGPLSSPELLERLNQRLRTGTTMHSLGNVLSKCPAFVRVGTVQKAGIITSTYKVAKWDVDTSDEALDNAWTRKLIGRYG